MSKQDVSFSTFLKESFVTFFYTTLIITTVLLNGVLIAYVINDLQAHYGYELRPQPTIYVE